ncbi:MAG: rRNA (guanosine2251-2-O)-methyltransferase, partial [Bacteroidota bacterium]|nr:rRNA (guanosine2251-2-O)-methyltransferase [Bacteroidota bacterium]
HPVSLMLHRVRSLYNVGSIFRTSDSALVKDLVLCEFTPHPPRKEIEKTALGAVDSVPWRYFKKTEDAIGTLKSEGNKIIAVEITDKKRRYDSLKIEEFPLCLVLGNELTGLDDEVLNLCDDAIEIPMHGVKHSLNVSVAAGIVVFEAVRIWNEKKSY